MVTKGPAAGRGSTFELPLPRDVLTLVPGQAQGRACVARAPGRAKRGLDLSLGHFGTWGSYAAWSS
jgi:hypothetical protein